MGRAEGADRPYRFDEVERVALDTEIEDRGAKLVDEMILFYPGVSGIAEAHARVYRRGGRNIVIVGELSDNPSTSITNAAEQVAAVIRKRLFPGGEPFELIEHYPAEQSRPHGTFDRVTFKELRRGDSSQFSDIDWSYLDPERIDSYVGAKVQIYQRDDYRGSRFPNLRVNGQSGSS